MVKAASIVVRNYIIFNWWMTEIKKGVLDLASCNPRFFSIEIFFCVQKNIFYFYSSSSSKI